MSLQLRGFKQREIAQMLGLNEVNVSLLVNRPHYLEAFDRQLGAVDQEFLRLKPLAYRALQNGLVSDETTVGLRAAELWFKSMGYRGFGSTEDGPRLTAEDIAARLLAVGGGSVVISVERSETQGQGISPEGSE